MKVKLMAAVGYFILLVCIVHSIDALILYIWCSLPAFCLYILRNVEYTIDFMCTYLELWKAYMRVCVRDDHHHLYNNIHKYPLFLHILHPMPTCKAIGLRIRPRIIHSICICIYIRKGIQLGTVFMQLIIIFSSLYFLYSYLVNLIPSSFHVTTFYLFNSTLFKQTTLYAYYITLYGTPSSDEVGITRIVNWLTRIAYCPSTNSKRKMKFK